MERLHFSKVIQKVREPEIDWSMDLFFYKRTEIKPKYISSSVTSRIYHTCFYNESEKLESFKAWLSDSVSEREWIDIGPGADNN